jgi:hypothetical protein
MRALKLEQRITPYTPIRAECSQSETFAVESTRTHIGDVENSALIFHYAEPGIFQFTSSSALISRMICEMC